MFFDEEDYTADDEQRLVQSTKGEYDAEENVLRPKTLDAYVGQSKVKENLTVYMNAAKKRGRCLSTSFFTARPASARRRSRISSPTRWVDS